MYNPGLVSLQFFYLFFVGKFFVYDGIKRYLILRKK